MLRILSLIIAVLLSQMPTQAGATLITGSMMLDVQYGVVFPDFTGGGDEPRCGGRGSEPACDPALLTFQFNPAVAKSFRYLVLNEAGTEFYSILDRSFLFAGSELSNAVIGCLGDSDVEFIDTDCPGFDFGNSPLPAVILQQSIAIGLGTLEIDSSASFKDSSGNNLSGERLVISAGPQGATGFFSAGTDVSDNFEDISFIPLLNTLQLKTVPEPAAYGLVLLGFGFIAMLRRRRAPRPAPVSAY